MTTTVLPSIDRLIHTQSLTGQVLSGLLGEGYSPEKAYRIARIEVDEWVKAQASGSVSYHITPHPLGWVVRQPTTTPCLVFMTCAEAVKFGQVLAQRYACTLIVHQANGRMLTRLAYA